MQSRQLSEIGKSAAHLIHNTIAWEEALNGDDINILVTSFKKELDELNGNQDISSITYKELAIKMGGEGEFAMGGIESIQCNAKVLKELAKQYPEMFDLEENQNDSPTVGEFLEIAQDDDIFITYVVSDSRDDKRVSIEGIITYSMDVKETLLQSKPDEYDKDGKGWRLWWD